MSAAAAQPAKGPALNDLIRAVASAKSERQLNDALWDLHAAAWPRLRPLIAWGLEQRRVYGQGASLDEPEDIYNQVLYRVARAAPGRHGDSEAEAEAWLKRIAQRLVEDSVKTARKRRERWRSLEWLARILYPRQFDQPPCNQEQDHDLAGE